jgi:hypothetical protein
MTLHKEINSDLKPVLPVFEKVLEVRKHAAGHVTTKENRDQRMKRKPSGINKSKKSKQFAMYDSVFEEGKASRKSKGRSSILGTEVDWSSNSNYNGVQGLLRSFKQGKYEEGLKILLKK